MLTRVALPRFLRNLEDRTREKLQLSAQKALRLRVPHTDDELWQALGHRFGRWYARRPVCAGHDTPFDFIASAYFERAERLFGMAAAGTGKTNAFADLHILNSETRPGCWTAHVGAIERQARRCWDYLETALGQDKLVGKEIESVLRPIAVDGVPLRSMVKWRNGSKLEILAGTLAQVCLPHSSGIVTAHGVEQIGQLIAHRDPGPVKSWDPQAKRFVWKPIVGWHDHGWSADDCYLCVKLAHQAFAPPELTATPNHEILMPSGEKIPLERFRVGDVLPVSGYVPSPAEQQVILGTLLGDGSVTREGQLSIVHGEKQADYLAWKMHALHGLGWSTFRHRGGFGTMGTRGRSRAHLWLHQQRDRWYPDGPKHRIPAGALEDLAPLALAVWLMDDGWCSRHGWWLACDRWDADSREQIEHRFRRDGLPGSWLEARQRPGQFTWSFTARASRFVDALTAPFFAPSPDGGKHWAGGEIEPGSEGIVFDPIASITRKELAGRKRKCDLTITDTHNYVLSSGIVVANSGPHPGCGAIDEFELGSWEVWTHFATKIHQQPNKRAQMILGSTRFRAKGPVERLLAEKQDVFTVKQWCVYDAMARCEYDCNHVPGFGRCPLWSRKEVQADGSVDEVPMCAGKAHFATGHLSVDEVIQGFLLSDHDTWATIMELRKPSGRGLYFPEFDDRPEGRHVRSEYVYVPGRPVYLGYDEGFNFPLVVGAWQLREDGVLYRFDGLYRTQTLVRDVIEELAERPWIEDCEIGWPDPTARAGIEEFRRFFQRRLGRPVMVWTTDSDRLNGWKVLRRRLWGWDGRATIGWHPSCERAYQDLAGLVKKEGTEDCEKVDDHGADEARYVAYNLERYLGIRQRLDADAFRPQGAMDRDEKARLMRVEGQIRERWDQLVKLGVPDGELRLIEGRFGARRDDLNQALGGLIREHGWEGRLERAGLRRPPSREAQREETHRPA